MFSSKFEQSIYNPLYSDFSQLDLIDDTKYSYYRETENESRILKTPRFKQSTEFDFEVSNIEYPENLHKLYISKYYKSIKPSLCVNFQFLIYVSLDVCEIPDRCFENCSSLQTIKATNKLYKIGNSSFKNCSELTNIDNVISLYKIGFSAFENCKLFKQFIPAKIIEHDAYRNTGLIEVIINSNDNEKSANEIEIIEDSVFKDCSNLKLVRVYSVQLSNSVFRGCINLTEFQTNINYIDKYMFVNTGFEIFNIPESINLINEHALSNISNLNTLIINNVNLKIHYNQLFNQNNNFNIILNTTKNKNKKSELNNLIKFIINNQQFICYNSLMKYDIRIYRINSNPANDLIELMKIIKLENLVAFAFINLKDLEINLNDSNFKQFKILYVLIIHQYYINEEENNIKQLVEQINHTMNSKINITNIDILNNNLKEKLMKLKELRDIYELYKSKLEL